MPKKDKRLFMIDHEAGTVTLDADATVEAVQDGYRLSAPWYDGHLTTNPTSFVPWGDGNTANLNDVLGKHANHAEKDGEVDPVYNLADFPVAD